ncbi:MAG: BPSS1187 family protein [Candidatus Hodarchaeales archaeon]|jgi:hypothetical protein
MNKKNTIKTTQMIIISLLILFLLNNQITGTSSVEKIHLTNNQNNIVELFVPANLTDPQISHRYPAHDHANYILINKSIQSKGILWVHLPGALGNPLNYGNLTTVIASQGYHTISLMYSNDYAINMNCLDDPDPKCYDYIRLEIFDGINRTNLADEERNPANSILNRLSKLLEYLNINYPDDDWEQYLNSTTKLPIWHKIAFSGISFGAGEVGIIAQKFSLARMVFLAGPQDWNAWFNHTPNWIGSSFATSLDRMYGFIHIRDSFVVYSNKTPQNWEKIGLGQFGPPIFIDNHTYPYNNSHMLFTDYDFNYDEDPCHPCHGGIGLDHMIPFDANGDSIFLPVWKYLVENVTPANSRSFYSPPTSFSQKSSYTSTTQDLSLITSSSNESEKVSIISSPILLIISLSLIYLKKKYFFKTKQGV